MARDGLARVILLLVLLVAAVLGAKGRLRDLDEGLWDRLQQKLPAPEPALSLALVGIGERSVEEVGGFPFPRSTYARLLEVLAEAGAASVTLDVFFSGATDPREDAALAEAVRAHRALLPFHAGPRTHLDGEGRVVREFVVDLPPREIRAGAGGLGFANLPVEANPDDVYRRVWLVQEEAEGVRHPALGVVLARRHARGPAVDALPAGLVRLDMRPFRALDGAPQGPLVRVELADVLAGEPEALAAVRGRAVLVGATAPRLGDVKATPLGAVPGALLHAVVAENVAAGRWVRELPAAVPLLLVVPLAATLLRGAPALWPLAGLATMLLGVVAATLALLGAGAWLPPAAAVAGGGAVLLGSGLLLLAPGRRGDARLRDPARATAWVRAALEEGDDREARRRVGALHPEAAAALEVRLLHARALVPAHMEGALRKVLEGCRGRAGAPEERLRVVRDLEDAGMPELALEELEEIEAAAPSTPEVGEWLARLREERDRRWGILSPRQVRDLLGRDHDRLRPLAEGAEGIAFLGRRREDGALVVLKVLHPRALEDPAALERFRREGEALGAVEGPDLPRLLGVSKGRLPFLVLEAREGEELAGRGRPEATAARSVLFHAARAVRDVHRAGWVHRDVKPENLVVEDSGAAVLIDFGLAARRGEDAEAGGTVGFAPPEQLAGGPASEAMDVYALGRLGAWLGVESPVLEAARAAEPGARPSADALVEELRAAG